MYAESELEERLRKARDLIGPRLGLLAERFRKVGAEELVKYMTKDGKMLRGFLTILVAESLGGNAEETIDAAAAIELVQAASLALDDIVDFDSQRRGRPAAWLLYGVGKSAMISLLLVPTAIKMVERYGPAAVGYSIEAWEAMVRGELLDAYLAVNTIPTDYLQIVRLKTATLFSLAAVLGAIAADRQDLAETAWKYGEEIGIAYQLADDLTDYTTYLKGSKPKLDPSERLFAQWAGGRSDATLEEVEPKAIDEIEAHSAKAAELATQLSEHGPNEPLRLFPYFAVNKMFKGAGLSLPILSP